MVVFRKGGNSTNFMLPPGRRVRESARPCQPCRSQRQQTQPAWSSETWGVFDVRCAVAIADFTTVGQETDVGGFCRMAERLVARRSAPWGRMGKPKPPRGTLQPVDGMPTSE